MTNFYKITKATGQYMHIVGTCHLDKFHLFPKNWLDQIVAFNPTHLLHEHNDEPEEAARENQKSIESQRFTLSKSDEAACVKSLKSSTFLKLEKVEQVFMALVSVIFRSEFTETEKAIAKRDIEIIKNLYIVNPKVDIEGRYFTQNIGDKIAWCISAFKDEDLLVRRVIEAATFLIDNDGSNTLDGTLIAHVQSTNPSCAVTALEDFNQTINDMAQDSMALLEGGIKQFVHEVIVEGITLSMQKHPQFTCMDWSNKEFKAKHLHTSHAKRNSDWYQVSISLLQDENARILWVIGDEHNVTAEGIISKILSLPHWLGASVTIHDSVGTEYQFNPIKAEISDYDKDIIELADIEPSSANVAAATTGGNGVDFDGYYE